MTLRRQEGNRVEEIIRRMMHGDVSHYDEVDFFTKRYAVEVKSCLLATAILPHKRKVGKHSGRGVQFGRFTISYKNHIKLRTTAAVEGKTPIYVFVLRYNGQFLRRALAWDAVDKFVKNGTETTHIHSMKVFL